MIHRRGVLPVLLLLVLVVVAGVAAQSVRGPAAAKSGSARPAGSTPAAPTGAAGREVLRSLAAVERAYAAGDVRQLCRPGVVVDPAVIRAQNARRDGCEGEIERLIANDPRLRVTVRTVALRPDLATATVVAANGTSTAIDFVRRGRRWLLSFSHGNDPMPALAGTA